MHKDSEYVEEINKRVTRAEWRIWKMFKRQDISEHMRDAAKGKLGLLEKSPLGYFCIIHHGPACLLHWEDL